MRVEESRLQFHGVTKSRKRVVVHTLPEMYITQVIEGGCRGWVDCQRFDNEPARFVKAPGLQCDDTHEVSCIEVPGRHRQNLPIRRLGIVEPACLVVRHAGAQKGADATCGRFLRDGSHLPASIVNTGFVAGIERGP